MSGPEPGAEAGVPRTPEGAGGEAAPRLMRETFLYLPAVIAPAIAGIVSIVVLTRLLSPTSFGHYSLAVTTALGISSVAGDWVTAATIRFYPEYPDEARLRRQLSTLAVLVAAGAACLVVPALGLATSAAFLAPATCLAVAQVAGKPAVGLARAQLKTALFSTITIAGSAGSILLGIGLFLVTDSPPALVWGSAIVAVVTSAAFAWGSNARDYLRRFSGIRELSPLLRFGLPMILTAAGGQILLLGDRYMLEAFAPTAAVGIYVPNYALADRSMGFVFTPIFNALYPLAAQAWGRGEIDSALDYLQKAQRGFAAIGGLAVALLLLHAPTISGVAVGSEFASGSRVVGIVAVGTLLWYQGILFHQPLEFDKRTAVIMLQVLAAGAVGIALNVILIPSHGIEGAAWATVGGYAFYMVTSYVFTRRLTGVALAIPWDTWVRVVAFIAGWAVVREAVGIPPWVGIPALPAAYVAFLYLTREPALATVAEMVRARRAR